MMGIKHILIFTCLIFCQACSTSPESRSVLKPDAEQTNLVIWDFDGANILGIDNVDYLSRVLPEMLLADLSRYPEIRLLERINLSDALEELKLGSSEMSDEASRLKIGKIIGANKMAFGHYLVSGKEIRITLRVVDTETSLTMFSNQKKGELDQLEHPVSKLARSIAMEFGTGNPTLKNNNATTLTSRKVWEEYEKGLELMDNRAFEKALAVFQGILTRNPGFKLAEKQIGFAIERMERE